MSGYFITTRRLGFRTWPEEDVELALGLWGDPAVTRLIDARGQLSEEQVRERLAQENAGVGYFSLTGASSEEHPKDLLGRLIVADQEESRKNPLAVASGFLRIRT